MSTKNMFGLLRRAPASSLSNRETVTRAVEDATFRSALDSAIRAGEERELRAAALAPIYKLIAKDTAALEAMRKLGDIRRNAYHPLARGDHKLTSVTGPGGIISSLALPPGTTAFSPPWDLKNMK